MSKKIWFYSLFFLTLIIVFYFMLTRIIPGYGKVALPKLSRVQPFSFLDQQGERITNRDVEGKVYVA
ncbi:MAG TPA: SCO family protein, partial [Puia sp.]|nr:SCO family protein [Puia sp.]